MSSEFAPSSWITSTFRFPAFVPQSAPEPGAAQTLPEIPHQYGADVLRLLPRHPQGLLAYWDIHADTKRRFADRLLSEHVVPHGRWELRWGRPTDLGAGPNPGRFLGEIVWLHGNWYFEVPPATDAAQAWLGYATPDGQFFPLLRSELVDLTAFRPARAMRVGAALRWRRRGGPDVEPPAEAARAFGRLSMFVPRGQASAFEVPGSAARPGASEGRWASGGAALPAAPSGSPAREASR